MLFERRPAEPLGIGPVTLAVTGGVHRLTADVGGVPAWIESSDTPLRKTPEAFGSAFILPSLHHGRPLALADPVDEVWLANARRLQSILHDWWGYRVRVPDATPAAVPAGGEPGGPAALFFSGGADSFWSLLRSGASLDRLVVIHGFDIPLEDTSRMDRVLTLARSAAAERGLRLVVVRTNLRAHPLITRIAWERAHGGVMMAVGHALGGVSEVLVSSSIPATRKRAWGSHWQIDPLHSSATRQFRQVGMELRRVEKLRQIAAEPVVQRHLRVCWQTHATAPNCQRCQKCILTRLVLAECGVLDHYSLLDGSGTLAQDVDGLGRYRDQLRSLGELSVSTKLDPTIRLAAERLLRRSRHAQRPWVRAARAVRSRIGAWTKGARA